MPGEFRVKIEGVKELQKKLSDPNFVKGPLRDFFEKSAFTILATAQELVPRDRSRLAGSIHIKIEPLRAQVGTNIFYAPFVEFGTRPHWPPIAAMDPWARRHGFPPGRSGMFLVARAIARKGTRAQPYMQPALEKSINAIKRFLRELGDTIKKNWSK